jgi:hypothetical protein
MGISVPISIYLCLVSHVIVANKSGLRLDSAVEMHMLPFSPLTPRMLDTIVSYYLTIRYENRTGIRIICMSRDTCNQFRMLVAVATVADESSHEVKTRSL